tara:strand:+ start:1205 stop:1603 length:399 start_codon:yes stop_codon:yes gene_type:complete
MVDPTLALLILTVSLVVGLGLHSLIRYIGRSTVIAWLLVQVAFTGAYLSGIGDQIFGYTVLICASPSVLVILLAGLPFEYRRRRSMSISGRRLIAEGGFACPHCGCAYDREIELGRCPDCGGAFDGGPGVLG